MAFLTLKKTTPFVDIYMYKIINIKEIIMN